MKSLSLADNHLVRRTDAVILRPQPLIRKIRSKELHTLLVFGPLRVIEVKTAKGKIAYKLQANSYRYVYPDDFKKLARQLFRKAYPENPKNLKARKHRYYIRTRMEKQ